MIPFLYLSLALGGLYSPPNPGSSSSTPSVPFGVSLPSAAIPLGLRSSSCPA